MNDLPVFENLPRGAKCIQGKEGEVFEVDMSARRIIGKICPKGDH